MIPLHFRLFLRIISKSRDVYFLKIVSLAITIACSSLVLLFAINEFRYDHFFADYPSVFRLLERNQLESYSGNRLTAKIPSHVYEVFARDQSVTLTRVKTMKEITIKTEVGAFDGQTVWAADSAVAEVFPFDVVEGNLPPFGNPGVTALISESRAKQYFGDNSPIGKTMLLTTSGNTVKCQIAAVSKDYPGNSHERFDLFIAFEPSALRSLHFDSEESSIYGRKHSGQGQADIEHRLNASLPPTDFHYRLQPLAEIYFGPHVLGENAQHGDWYSIVLLISLTGMIFFLVFTNYINLTTLTLPGRSKELAVKKLSGTGWLSVIGGFARESFSIVVLALVLGIMILWAASGFLYSILSIDIISIVKRFDPLFAASIAALSIVLAVAPLFLTFRFAKATPTRLLSTDTITFPRLKRIILFLQLGISMLLLVASLVMRRQITYSLLKEPGRNHEQVVYLDYPRDLTIQDLHNLRSSWKSYNPNILDVIGTSQLPDRIQSRELHTPFYFMIVDNGFSSFFDIRLRDKSGFRPNDPDSAFMVNAAGRKILGPYTRNDVGTFEDICRRFDLPEKPVKIIYTSQTRSYNYLCVRILEVDIRETVGYLSRYFAQGGIPARVTFLDPRFDEWVRYQNRLNILSEILAIISAVLSCLSIYGLSVSIVRDKLKQIAIYKLFGATTLHITRLLAREFLQQMVLSVIIFAPITYIILHEMLRTFVYATHFIGSDVVVPLGYCLTMIVLLCGIQAWSLSRRDLTRALKS